MSDTVNPDRSRTGKTWDNEENWWRQHFESRPYVQSGLGFDYYRPAYRYGVESANHHLGRSWREAEPDLRAGWARYAEGGTVRAAWEDVADAVRDAWRRVTGEPDDAESEANAEAEALRLRDDRRDRQP
jgi:hypothetical protein